MGSQPLFGSFPISYSGTKEVVYVAKNDLLVHEETRINQMENRDAENSCLLPLLP